MDAVRTASLLAFALALGGCVVGPKFKRPNAPINANWTAKGDPRIGTQTAADSLWWKGFKDPTLDRLVDLAYRQNLPLQIAGLRIVEARAELGIATGLQWPQLQQAVASANAVGVTQSVANYLDVGRNLFTYQVGFDVAWELDFWGKYRQGVDSEAASLLASVADYQAALVSLTAEVARTYTTVRTYEVLIEQTQENAGVQEKGLHIAESRFRNGATSELDVTQATTLLESTRASIPKLVASAQQARNALSTLLGQPPGAVDALLTGPREIPGGPATVSVSVPAEMLRRRPDIRSAELNAAAQCARIGVAKADLYPSFSLVGSIGLQANSAGPTTHNLFSGENFFYSIGPQITWPFFNYGRIENNVRVQDARLQQLLVDYRNTVLKAAQEVEDALAGFLNAQDAVVHEQNSVAAAQRSVDLAVTQYEEGAVDYQRVLDAQRSLLEQDENLTQIRSSVTTDLIALYKALGGGWEWSQGQPIVPEGTQREMKERTNWGDMLSQPRGPEAQKHTGAGPY